MKAILTIATGLWLAGGIASPAEPPTADYWVYVANESSDIVSLVRFGPQGASVERDIEVGIMPTDIEGAHGLSVEPGGAHFYVTLAHGTPFGKIWKIRTSDHALVDSVTLDRFPATIGITPEVPPALAGLEDLPESYDVITTDYEPFRDFLRQR